MLIPAIIPAERSHIVHVVNNMREADVAEFRALGLSPLGALNLSLSGSTESWTGTIDDDPVCMFGVSPSSALTPHIGRPWMAGTSKLGRHSILFLRRCKPQVERMLAIYPILENWIASSNHLAISWLKWLSFEMLETATFGTTEFIKFRLERKVEKNEIAMSFEEGVTKAENFLAQLPQVHAEPEHRFAEGLYCRTLTMPKDTIWVSRVHLHDNFAFIMQGSCIVVGENGPQTIVAPFCIKTVAGTKRMLRIIEDCTWVTVHAIPPELSGDVDKVEAYLAVDTLQEYHELEQKEVLP